MKSPKAAALATIATASALLASALTLPAAASAVSPGSPVLTEDAASSTCVVTSGELSWGVKESFRSYISGTIANGSWETSAGVTYETPLFQWADPTGEVDGETGEGTIHFPGQLNFTGHDGALDLMMANPTIVFVGDGTAELLFDTSSTRPTGEVAIDEEQAFIGKIDGVGVTDPASGAISFTDAPAVLTADGAAAFGGFYSSGDELDPVTLTLEFGPCAGSGSGEPVDGTSNAHASEGEEAAVDAADPENAQDAPVSPAPEETGGIAWLPIAVGSVALIVIGVTVGMLVAGRKKGQGNSANPTAGETE